VAVARGRLFEGVPARESGAARWVVAFAAVGAVAAIAFALRGSGEGAPAVAARGGDPTTRPASTSKPSEAFKADEGATSRVGTSPTGASELVLESGRARGHLGAEGGPHSVAAGSYRVTGDAMATVSWSVESGLSVEVTAGEARILIPGETAIIVSAGQSRTLPPR
jgi:hypothetical protein